MGFFGSIFGWVREKVEDAVDWVKDKLGVSSYSSSRIEDQINVDKVLAEYRESIQPDVDHLEEKCMRKISTLFIDLKNKTKVLYPELVEIISVEQSKAERELKGTVMRYVKEHLSKNDPQFLKVLEMQPGQSKKEALGLQSRKVLSAAEKDFSKKLIRYAEHVQHEFDVRLNTRIDNQNERMNQRIFELKRLESEARQNSLDIEKLVEKNTPAIEAAESIVSLLEEEDAI